MEPMGTHKKGALTDPGQGKARDQLDGHRGRGVFTQIAFTFGVIASVGALFLVAGTLLSGDAEGQGLAWAVLGGLVILAAGLIVWRRKTRRSLDEVLSDRR